MRHVASAAQTCQTVINFQNYLVADFATANFNPLYQSDGGGIGGQTINGNELLGGGNRADILQCGFGKDRLIGGVGNDILTGGGDTDIFDFNALAESTVTITDFTPGAGGDVLYLHDVLGSFVGITFNHDNAFTGGFLQFVASASGTDTWMQVDSDGGGNSYISLAVLTNTLPLSISTDNYLL